MKILVTGSAKEIIDNSTVFEKFKKDCRTIGRVLAQQSYLTMICSIAESTADRFVFEGICDALNKNTTHTHNEIEGGNSPKDTAILTLMTAINDTSTLEENEETLAKIKRLEERKLATIIQTSSRSRFNRDNILKLAKFDPARPFFFCRGEDPAWVTRFHQ